MVKTSVSAQASGSCRNRSALKTCRALFARALRFADKQRAPHADHEYQNRSKPRLQAAQQAEMMIKSVKPAKSWQNVIKSRHQ